MVILNQTKKILILTVPILVTVSACIISIGIAVSRANKNHGKVVRRFHLRLSQIYAEQYKKLTDTEKTAPLIGEEDPTIEFLNLLKPVSHLSGLDFETIKAEDTRARATKRIRNWENSEGSERNLMWNGISYENGSFVVPTSGLYRIVSHVKFYVENNRKSSGENKHFQHVIDRYDAENMLDSTIAFNTISECKEGINEGAHLEYPSDISVIARLNAGDQVGVKVSHWDLLRHDRDWQYFGMYLI